MGGQHLKQLKVLKRSFPMFTKSACDLLLFSRFPCTPWLELFISQVCALWTALLILYMFSFIWNGMLYHDQLCNEKTSTTPLGSVCCSSFSVKAECVLSWGELNCVICLWLAFSIVVLLKGYSPFMVFTKSAFQLLNLKNNFLNCVTFSSIGTHAISR